MLPRRSVVRDGSPVLWNTISVSHTDTSSPVLLSGASRWIAPYLDAASQENDTRRPHALYSNRLDEMHERCNAKFLVLFCRDHLILMLCKPD